MSSTRFDSEPCVIARAGTVPSWLLRAGRIVSPLVLAAIVALVVREVLTGRLGGAVSALSRAGVGWVSVAIACELLSYGFYAAAQQRLLGQVARGFPIRWLASLAVCAQAVNNFLPAGYIAANLLNFRELRRRGLSGSASASLLVMTSGLYIGALSCLTLLAGELAGGQLGGSLQAVRLGAAAALVVLLVGAVAAHRLLKRGVLRPPRAWRAAGNRPRVSRGAGASAAGLFIASWFADAGCLFASIHAIGAHPAWSLVPIAYCGAQLVSFLPVTPGGLGLVEGSLTVALIAAGGGQSSLVLASVLLYRIITYWGTLPCGLLGYLVLRRARPRGTTGSTDAVPALADRAAGGERALLVLGG